MRFNRIGRLAALLAVAIGLVLALSFQSTPPAKAAGPTTVVVRPGNTHGWGFFQDSGSGGSGHFVIGPGTPPLGSGSVELSVPTAPDGEIVGTMQFAGTRFADISSLSYSTYRSTSDSGDVLALALQFDVDYNLTDANTSWQGRLVFEPYNTPATVPQNTWQTWTPLTGKWWSSGAPGNTFCPQSAPCTWAQVLANWPNAGLRASNGVVQFKAGSGWSSPFVGNADALTVGVGGNDTTFDFEATPACTMICYVNAATGDDNETGASPAHAFKTIQAGLDTVSPTGTVQVAEGTYAENLTIAKPLTLQGAGQNKVTVVPAVSNPNACSGSSLCGGNSSNVILVRSDDVTITGLTIDGDNPALSSGNPLVGGADIDARNGIITDYYSATYHNLTVHHVTVKNIFLRGIYSTAKSGESGNSFNFNHDTVTNVQADPASIAMFNFGGSGVFSDNLVIDASDAISSNWSTGTQFLRNTIKKSSSGVHTDNTGAADVISDNTVSNCDAGGYGIWVFAPYLRATVDHNTVSGCAVGLATFGSNDPADILFTNNDVTGDNSAGSMGAWITTDQLGFCVGDVSATLSGNVFRNAETGIRVDAPAVTAFPFDPPLDCVAYGLTSHAANVKASNNLNRNNGTGLDSGAGTVVTLTGSCVRNNKDGGVLNESGASTKANQNNIINNNAFGANNADATQLNFESNFWGNSSGPKLTGPNKVIGNLDTTSWLPSAGSRCSEENWRDAGSRVNGENDHEGDNNNASNNDDHHGDAKPHAHENGDDR